MSNIIQTLLNQKPFIVVDGGGATELEKRGCDLNDELWSAKVVLENPEKIRAVHDAYIDAGADVIKTMTYQASLPGYRAKGLSEAAAQAAITQTIALANDAKQAAMKQGRRILVAASLGPYGAYLADGSEYKGNYAISEEELRDFHRQRLETFMQVSFDLVAVETIPEWREARIIAELLDELGLVGWLSFSCQDETALASGESLAEATAAIATHPSILAIGVNCIHPRYIEGLLETMMGYTTLPFIVYPNSGETYDPTDKTWHTEKNHSDFFVLGARWFRSGARLIGGCCRTGPDDIRRLTDLVDELSTKGAQRL